MNTGELQWFSERRSGPSLEEWLRRTQSMALGNRPTWPGLAKESQGASGRSVVAELEE